MGKNKKKYQREEKNELQFNNEFGLYVSDGDSHMDIVVNDDDDDRLHPTYVIK